MTSAGPTPENEGIDPELQAAVESAFEEVPDDVREGLAQGSPEGAASHRDAGAAGVVEALIPVLDEIELARQHGDLTGTFETTAGKLESILAEKYSLERFGAVGEVFDPTLHEALMATESSEVTEPTIAAVLQPGYRLGERVVRAARVQVANPA